MKTIVHIAFGCNRTILYNDDHLVNYYVFLSTKEKPYVKERKNINYIYLPTEYVLPESINKKKLKKMAYSEYLINMCLEYLLKNKISCDGIIILQPALKFTKLYIKMMSVLKCKNIYLISHGLWGSEKPISSVLKFIIGDQVGYEIWTQKIKGAPCQLIKVNGIPQFDYLLRNKDKILEHTIHQHLNLDPQKKLALILPSYMPKHLNHLETYQEFIEINQKYFSWILESLDSSYCVLIKEKQIIPESLRSHALFDLNTKSNIIYLDPKDNIYDYLGVDLIFIFEGTAVLEALLVNPKNVITFDHDLVSDNKSMICHQKDDVKRFIKMIEDNDFDQEYLNNVNQFITDLIGGPIEPVSGKIIEIILSGLK